MKRCPVCRTELKPYDGCKTFIFAKCPNCGYEKSIFRNKLKTGVNNAKRNKDGIVMHKLGFQQEKNNLNIENRIDCLCLKI